MTEEERELLLKCASTLVKIAYDTGYRNEAQGLMKKALAVQQVQNSYLKPRNAFKQQDPTE